MMSFTVRKLRGSIATTRESGERTKELKDSQLNITASKGEMIMRIILAILFVAYLLITHDRLRHILMIPVKIFFGLIGILGIIVMLELMLAVFGW